jgi:hypothetical protein
VVTPPSGSPSKVPATGIEPSLRTIVYTSPFRGRWSVLMLTARRGDSSVRLVTITGMRASPTRTASRDADCIRSVPMVMVASMSWPRTPPSIVSTPTEPLPVTTGWERGFDSTRRVALGNEPKSWMPIVFTVTVPEKVPVL